MTRVATIALERNDARLAVEVVQSGPSGTTNSGLEDLASSGAPLIVEGRTIGLLVSTGSGPLGIRSAQVLAGAIAALRAGGQNPSNDGVRLVTRDLRDPLRAEAGLASLASQGAAVIIAGLTPSEALTAAQFAKATQTPTILLSMPSSPVEADSAFVLGDSEEHETEQKLWHALQERNAHTVVTLQDSDDRDRSAPLGSSNSTLVASCLSDSHEAGGRRFPVQSWKLAHVQGLLSLAFADCTREAILEASKALPSPLVSAVGFQGGEIAFSPPGEGILVVASAGSFPLTATDTRSPLEALRKHRGDPPTWSMVLGHDAAVLARAAVQDLPQQRTEDQDGIVALHKRTTEALAKAQADLYSTEVKGFSGRHVIMRTVFVREIAP